MKRIFSLILVALVLLASFSVSAYEDYMPEEIYEEFYDEEFSEIRINVNVENGILNLNDTPVEGTAAYLKNNTTMIPIDVIVNAFGAEIMYEADKITINYFDAEMIFFENSKDVYINDQVITMPEIVEVYEGTYMAPLRFLAESFGADVIYDSESKDIIITGSKEGLGVEGDFKMLLKYGNKSKVGNSKELWRFNKPSDFDMMEYYWGGGYEFAIEDIYFQLTPSKNRNKMTLDQLYIVMQTANVPQYSSEGVNTGVLIEKYKGTRSGLPYVSMVRRTTGGLNQMSAFLTEKFVYIFTVFIPVENYINVKDTTTFDTILDSFEANYTGGDDDTIDISVKNDAKKEKKELYKDGNYSWEITPVEDWTVAEYYGFFNRVNITRESKVTIEEDDEEEIPYYYYSSPIYSLLDSYYYYESKVSDAVLNVSVYSNPNGQSVSDWVSGKYALEKDNINPEYLTISEITDIKIGESDAKTFSKETKYEKYTWCQKFFYIYKDKYRYILNLNYDKRDSDEAGFMDNAMAMVNSFVPGDINYDDLGEALERDNYLVTDKVLKTYENKYIKMELPYLWNAYGYSDGSYVSVYNYNEDYSTGESGLTINRIFLDKVDENGELFYRTVEEFAKADLITIRNSNLRNLAIMQPLEKITYKGREAYKLEIGNKPEDKITISSEIIYIKGEDNDCFIISVTNSDMNKGTKTDKMIQAVLDSLEFK